MCTRLKLVPFALCAMGLVFFTLSGCKKDSEKEAKAPSHTPASYLKDPVFRKQIAEKRKALQAIAAERKPLADRMQELVREHKENLAALQKIPEWNDLHKKVVALNEKYEKLKREQFAQVSARITHERGKREEGTGKREQGRGKRGF